MLRRTIRCARSLGGTYMTRTYRLGLKYSLLASVTTATLVLSGAPAFAAQPASPPPAPPATVAQLAPTPVNGDEIVVTGTRRSDRTVTNSASPIDVISSQELTAQPTANMLDTIKNIVPSFYVPTNSISDASTFV